MTEFYADLSLFMEVIKFDQYSACLLFIFSLDRFALVLKGVHVFSVYRVGKRSQCYLFIPTACRL